MPLYYFFAFFVGLPLLELALLLKIHEVFHFWPTFLLVVLTGIAGLTLVRRQGVAVLQKIQRETAIGNLPAPELIDGAMILVSGAFLLTPGLITDTVALLLLIPFVRTQIRFWIGKKLKEKIETGSVQIRYHQEIEEEE
jgi:UPF0716 protein FxsA